MNDVSLAEVFKIIEANPPGFLKDTKVELKAQPQRQPLALVVLLIQSDQSIVAKASNINITKRIYESIKQKNLPEREALDTVCLNA